MRNRPKVLSAALVIASLLSTVLLIGCSKTAPQRPTRLGESKVDSTLLQMITMNERMADEADHRIVQWVKEQSSEWTQLECGAWQEKSSSKGGLWNGNAPEQGAHIRVRMIVRTLDGRMIEDIERTVTIGREEGIPEAVLETLTEGFREARLVCPWYSGFGAQGDKRVNGYENVVIEVSAEQ